MDNNERNSPRDPVRDWSTMSGSPTPGTSGSSGTARQLARNKGLAWVSAITLGAGAASALGTAAIALTLASPTVATTASAGTTTSAGTAATSASKNTDDEESGSTQQAAPLQAAPAPATSNNAPVATSAAS